MADILTTATEVIRKCFPQEELILKPVGTRVTGQRFGHYLKFHRNMNICFVSVRFGYFVLTVQQTYNMRRRNVA